MNEMIHLKNGLVHEACDREFAGWVLGLEFVLGCLDSWLGTNTSLHTLHVQELS